MLILHKKGNLQVTQVNATKVRKLCADKITFILGKHGGYSPSGSGNRSIVVVRQISSKTKPQNFKI